MMVAARKKAEQAEIRAAVLTCNTWFAEDWCRYFTEVLGLGEESIWDKMREIVGALQRHRRVAVKAGNGTSKTFTAAAIANCFSDIYGPSCTVVTTAPTAKHLEDVLWGEIKNQRANAKIRYGGDVTGLDITRKGSPKWIFTGLTVRPDNVTQQAAASRATTTTTSLSFLTRRAVSPRRYGLRRNG